MDAAVWVGVKVNNVVTGGNEHGPVYTHTCAQQHVHSVINTDVNMHVVIQE